MNPEGRKEKNQDDLSNREEEAPSKLKDREDLPEKKGHRYGDGKLFPIHTWIYFLYIIFSVILPIFGTLLIITGNETNTGYFSLKAIINAPEPKIEVEDPKYHAMALLFLQYTCWVSGFFFWLFALYLIYLAVVYHMLIWSSRPWDSREWSGVRNAADQELVICKVRNEMLEDQFTRMTEKQQEKMNKFKRPLLYRGMEMSYSDDGDNEKISKIGKTYGEKNQELV